MRGLACRVQLEGCDPGVLNIVVIAEARVHNLGGETTATKEGTGDNSGICVQVRQEDCFVVAAWL